ncbi:MAG: hypothetical protein WCN95_12715, partial [bacterium]
KDPAVRWGLHDGDKTGALIVSAAVAEAPLYQLPRHLIADAPIFCGYRHAEMSGTWCRTAVLNTTHGEGCGHGTPGEG